MGHAIGAKLARKERMSVEFHVGGGKHASSPDDNEAYGDASIALMAKQRLTFLEISICTPLLTPTRITQTYV